MKYHKSNTLLFYHGPNETRTIDDHIKSLSVRPHSHGGGDKFCGHNILATVMLDLSPDGAHVSKSRSHITIYTHRQINLYCMIFVDFSVNSQPILMKFCKDCFRVTWRLQYLKCKFVITTSFYKPIKMVKLKFVLSPELH